MVIFGDKYILHVTIIDILLGWICTGDALFGAIYLFIYYLLYCLLLQGHQHTISEKKFHQS